jgi:hypothetical protein
MMVIAVTRDGGVKINTKLISSRFGDPGSEDMAPVAI